MVEQPNDRQVGARPAPNLVGRADLVARLGLVIASGDHRLITLVGPGGVGKTSLARVLTATADRPVTFAELAAIDEDELILPVVAAALGIASIGAGGLLDAVATVLGAESPLLILDNLEQLPGAGRVVRALLEANPELTILATSRARLRVPDELVVEIEPLAVPASTGDDLNIETLRGYAAIELFESRARQVLPEFELTARNGRSVAEIVRRLDGIPLGIELVTSRARTLSIADMSAHLDELLPLPASSDRPAPERQRTMLASIAWSVALLPESTQTALARLSVFPGSFDLDAARVVADAGLGDIDLLLEHQLLRLVDRGEPSHRFAMLESVRQFGLDRLKERDEATAIRDRHVVWRQALTNNIVSEYFGPNADAAVRRHLTTIADWHQAIGWSLTRDNVSQALRLYIDLNPHWSSLPWETSELWWQRLEPLIEREGLDPGLVAMALIEAGRNAYGAGDLRASDRRFIRATAIARKSGDLNTLALALRSHGATLRGLGEPERAAELLLELRAIVDGLSDPVAHYSALLELGAQALMLQNDLATARHDFERALELTRAAGARTQEGNVLHFLGYVAAQRDDLDIARDAFRRSVALLRDGPETQRLASLHGLGRTELLAGRFADAYDALSESLAGRRRRGETLQVRLILTDLALLARASGRPRLAAEWLGAVGLDASLLSPKRFFADRWIEAIDLIRAELGHEEFERALERGRLIGLTEAVESALAFATPSAVHVDTEQAEIARLSQRELEVLRLIVEGSSDRQIAEALFISPLTATRHVKNILRKLDVPTRTAAAMLAVRRGIIRTDS